MEEWKAYMSTETEKWLSIEEISEHIQAHKDTICIWIRKGKIPAQKIGKQWQFRISGIDERVNSGKSADINRGASMQP